MIPSRQIQQVMENSWVTVVVAVLAGLESMAVFGGQESR
jgi:hypothetical protein